MQEDISIEQLEGVFETVVNLPEDERAGAIASACAGNPELERRVLALLEAHQRTGIVDNLAGDLAAPLSAAFDRAPRVGNQIGPYRITGLLGRGGMGNVYQAERVDGQFEQQVALKLLREGIDSESTRARFVHERQLLARLQHPGIARLLDGGLDDVGRPFFAMEVVTGERIDQYCDAKGLQVDARLRLFCEVCEAVRYAHANLVVHRDLKPSNIMVRTDRTDGSTRGDHVVLLDFGIAKLLQDSATESADAPATRVMTPEYAAPEQIRGEAATTAADVYSLGVVLYELLAGTRPYDVSGLSPGEVESVICDDVPPTPSEAITRETSERRGTEPGALSRTLSGDLDTIVMKALAKEPERRYGSAEAFLNDIQRYLDGLPVTARPDTLGYRVAKFVRRNRIAVAAASLVLVVAAVGVAGIVWQSRQTAEERDRAQIEAAKAEEALGLLVDLFQQADPGQTEGEEVSARMVLDRAADRVTVVDDEPVVRATLLDALGGVYFNLGLYDRARDLYSEAIDTRRQLASEPANSADIGKGFHMLSQAYFKLSNMHRADSASALAVTSMREAGPAYVVGLASALHMRAATLRQIEKTEEALQAGEEALALQKEHLSEGHTDIGSTMYLLAAIRHDTGDFAGSEPMFRDAIALFEASPDSISIEAADAAALLGMYLTFKSEFDEAATLIKRALHIRATLYGDTHPMVIESESQLGTLLYQQGQAAEAEPYLRRAVEKGEQVMGPGQYGVLSSKQALGVTLYDLGQFPEAAEMLGDALAGYREIFGGDHGVVATTLTLLGNVELEMGSLARAERSFAEGTAMARRVFGEAHPYVGRSLQGEAAVANRLGRYAQAESRYREALEMLEGSMRPGHHLVGAAKKDLGRFLVRRDRVEEGLPLLREAVEIFTNHYGDENRTVQNTRSMLGEALAKTGRDEEGIAMMQESIEKLTAHYGAEHRRVAEATARLEAFAKR